MSGQLFMLLAYPAGLLIGWFVGPWIWRRLSRRP